MKNQFGTTRKSTASSGSRPLPDGTIVYDPAPLTRAAMGGHAFYMDEIMRCSVAQVEELAALYRGERDRL